VGQLSNDLLTYTRIRPSVTAAGWRHGSNPGIIGAVFVLLVVQGGLSDSLTSAPLLAIATLFGAGVLTSLTPCIYPMIPITAGILAGAGGEHPTRTRTIGLTLAYVSGLALLYATMGLVAGLSGSLFGTVAASPWARLALGNLLLLFGLVMLDVIPLTVPRRLTAWAGGLGGGSYPAVFVLGATSGIVAAPCGAPAFAVVLTWVTTTQSGLLGFVYLFVFSLGMTALLVVVGVFSGTLAMLPKSGRWMTWIKKAAGLIMLGMAEYYFIQMGMVY
jgi:thiol:disulfide interchange protein DsbD